MAGRLPHLQTRYYPPTEQSTTPGGRPIEAPSAVQERFEQAPRPMQESTPAQESRSMQDSRPTQVPRPAQEPRPVESRPKVNADLLPRPVLRFDEYFGGFVPGNDPPPHVYSAYTVKEETITSPRYVRLVSTTVALDAKAQAALGIPIACVLQPLCEFQQGEDPPPISDVTTKGPFRCSRCMAYVNPFFTFPDHRSTTCNLCGLTQPCPPELATERTTRAELFAGTYDFQVSHEFVVKPPQLNTFVICLDVSAEAIASGLTLHVLNSLKASVDYVPCPERSRIAIMTYGDRFTYYRPCESGQVAEVIINETEDPFVADSIEALAFRLDSQKAALIGLLEVLEQKVPNGPHSKQLLSPCAVASAAKDLLNQTGGRVMIFLSSLGTIGKMSLRLREEQKLANTENEKSLFIPQHDGVYDLAKESCAAGITFDCFACGRGYMDTASMYPLCSITGGDLHYFPNYSQSLSEQLHFTIVRTLTRPQVFQVLMRVRCSNGLAVDEYIGHFLRRGPTDMEIASLDADKSFAVLLRHEEKLKEGQQYYIQVAMLHTAVNGGRFIRVFNTAVKASSDSAAVYKSSDCDAMSNAMMKKQLLSLLTTPLKTIRESWHESIVSLLCHYRGMSSVSKETTSLMLPETLNFLPLFTLCALKSPAFGTRSSADARMAAVAKLKAIPLVAGFLMLYPRIYSVHDLMEQSQQPGLTNASEMVALPNLVAASGAKVVPTGAYLMDNGDALALYVGAGAPSEFLLDVLRS